MRVSAVLAALVALSVVLLRAEVEVVTFALVLALAGTLHRARSIRA